MVLPSVEIILGWMLLTEKEKEPGCGATPSALTAGDVLGFYVFSTELQKKY